MKSKEPRLPAVRCIAWLDLPADKGSEVCSHAGGAG